MEMWKTVRGFDRYEVSNLGNVRNSLTGKPMKAWTRGRYGHMSVGLRREGKTHFKYVHVLVMAAFVGDKPEGLETRHLDGNPKNNILSNLKYGTPSENRYDSVKHGTHRSGLKH